MKLYYKLFFVLTLIFGYQSSSNSYAQNNSIVLNGAYIVLDGGTAINNIFVVVDQPSPAGIVRLPAGGHIHSENQYNFVKWLSASTTGSYVFPFGVGGNTADYIPFTFNKTVGNSSISTSTWATNIQNTPHPATTNVAEVTNMLGITDSVLYAIDRFWDIQATTTTADLTFSYRGIENTTISPTSLIQAQHWNGSTWDAPVGPGTIGVTAGIGTTGPYIGQNTFSPWVLIVPCTPDSVTQNPVICQGSSITVGTNTYTTTGVYIDDLINVIGCDSVVTTNLTVNPHSTGTDIQAACITFTWIDGNTYTTNNNTATHTLTGGAANGCDSIVTLNLTINNTATGTDTQIACDTYSWIDGNTYTASNNTATHTLTGGAANGCDSIVTLNLTINNTATGTDTQIACDTYSWIDGNTYVSSNNTATHTLTGGAANGCDSIVTLNLTINNTVAGTDTQIACDNYTWIDGNTYTASNNTATHTLTGGATNGCDSIVTLNLTINNTVYGTDTQVACITFNWIDGNTYTASNNTATHTLTGGAVNGCDSIVTLNLTINNTVTGTDTQIACDNYTWIDGNTYTANNNTATHTLNGGAANGCDSIVTLNLTINNSTTGTDTQIACDNYTWIDGNTYTTSNNTATHTLTGGAANGCDSIVTLNLTINNTAAGTDTQVACGSFSWINGNTYTASNNTATHTLTGGAANGCDSIVTLNLTINQSTTGTDVQSACVSFSWIDGNTYTSSNTTATHTIVGGNSNGCDSIVTLNLVINQATTGTDTRIACGNFVWIDGNTYTTNNNTATHIIIGGNANGCDSTVTLNLTIQNQPVVNATSNSPVCEGEILNLNASPSNGATYQWTGPNGFTSQIQNPTIATSNVNNTGTYQVIATTGNNCADTAQVNVTVHPRPILNSIIINDSCTSNIGQIIILATSTNPPLTYSWSNGSTDTLLTELPEGDYEVIVSDNTTCSVSESFEIFNIFDDCHCFVYVANAFSPNGDKNNDLIPVRGECVSMLTFKIFNRWGNLVFETDKLNEGWDGYYQGKLQNTGVYVYTLEATFENGKTTKESGDISLIR